MAIFESILYIAFDKYEILECTRARTFWLINSCLCQYNSKLLKLLHKTNNVKEFWRKSLRLQVMAPLRSKQRVNINGNWLFIWLVTSWSCWYWSKVVKQILFGILLRFCVQQRMDHKSIGYWVIWKIKNIVIIYGISSIS